MGTRNGVAEPAQNRYPYYHTDCRRPLQPNLAGRSMNPTNHNRTTNLATANLAARVRANSEFYYSDRNTSGIRRQGGRGNVLKASLEYYDTVKIRLEMDAYRGFIGDVTTLHRRVHVRGDVPRSIFACVRCLIRRIKVIGYGNLAYGERKGRGFISTLLANTKKFYSGFLEFLFFYFSFFLVSVVE